MIEASEKQNRQGLLLNLTGNGKGKTTSALGTACRALGWGWRIVIIQFVKSERETGERHFFLESNRRVEFFSLGVGATWTPEVTTGQHEEAALAAWQKAQEYLDDPAVDLLILDELNIAVNYGWLPVPDVIMKLQHRPASMHVIVTGRYADPALLEASDLVSEIKEIKHPYHKGITSQIGIEY